MRLKKSRGYFCRFVLIVRRNFILQATAPAATAASLLFNRFEFAIQKFNLLLLFINRLIEFLDEIFGKAQLDFEIGDAFFGHMYVTFLFGDEFKAPIFHFCFRSNPEIMRLH